MVQMYLGITLIDLLGYTRFYIHQTNSTGCSEVVGEAGISVDAGDVQGITTALVKLTSNPDLCRRLGQSARKQVEAHCTWTIVANRYIELYKK